MPVLNWKTTREEAEMIRDITDRAVKMAAEAGRNFSPMDINMDITACHANGCRLALKDLLEADNSNFGHDVFGIYRHLDRETGKLTDCFLPRYAA